MAEVGIIVTFDRRGLKLIVDQLLIATRDMRDLAYSLSNDDKEIAAEAVDAVGEEYEDLLLLLQLAEAEAEDAADSPTVPAVAEGDPSPTDLH